VKEGGLQGFTGTESSFSSLIKQTKEEPKVRFKVLNLTLSFFLLLSPNAKADCFKTVGEKFHIEPLLLRAIADKESNLYNHAINHSNKNHTEDVCMMGINSSHFQELKRFGITRQRLLKEPCVCVAAGAWILNGFFRKYGRSWNTVGMYNTGNNPGIAGIRIRYANSVHFIYERLEKEEGVWKDPFSY